MLDELKSFPVKAISFRQEMYDRYLGKYTAVTSNSDGMVDSVKNNLTKGLSQILPHLKEEAEYAVRDSWEIQQVGKESIFTGLRQG
jgi:hypothetical protein